MTLAAIRPTRISKIKTVFEYDITSGERGGTEGLHDACGHKASENRDNTDGI